MHPRDEHENDTMHQQSNASSAPEYLLARDPDGYSAAWADRRLRRVVLLTGFPIAFIGFPFGVVYFLILTWYAAGFRCPRCHERFAKRRLSLLLGGACTACSVLAGSKRDLTESPMFPRLFDASERPGDARPYAPDERPLTPEERGDENNPFRPPAD